MTGQIKYMERYRAQMAPVHDDDTATAVGCWMLKGSQQSLPSSHYSLAAIHEFSRKRFLLNKPVIIGRDPAVCQIVLPGAHVSRRHAELKVIDEGVYIKDLGSANGTFLNDRRIIEGVAQTGDRVRFDNVTLNVVGPEDPYDSTAAQPRHRSRPDQTMMRYVEQEPERGKHNPQPSPGLSINLGDTRSLAWVAGVCFGLGILIAAVIALVV